MRKKLVAGNWKMHGNLVQNQKLLEAVLKSTTNMRESEIAVCVPYPYLSAVQTQLANSHIKWGAQTVSEYDKGAYTGEVSTEMLNDFGCKYVIVGHSERRAIFGENSQTVALKYVAAQNAGIIPILCVGETLEQRESQITERVVAEQLVAVIEKAGAESLMKSVIAYEPVWAIGTGKTATPQQAQDVHEFIRKSIAKHNAAIASEITILYGGSVKANNARELFAMQDIDGGLIGGASLVADEFAAICEAAQN
ncbi:MAG: triose-phosphate isomerase [Nitrosomonas sp.]|nr:triose-phosphate isomerase [Nitrosomonas sp.]